MPDLIFSQTPKARRRHECFYSGCEIAPGERYSREVFKDSGAPYTIKACLGCTDLANDYCCTLYYEDGISPEAFEEEMHEQLEMNPADPALQAWDKRRR